MPRAPTPTTDAAERRHRLHRRPTAPSPPAPGTAPRTTGSWCTRYSTRPTSATSASSATARRWCCPRCTPGSASGCTCTARRARARCGWPARPDPGLAVCLTVTHVDGLVLARSAFHHSINYRSVVVHGVAHQVTDPEEKRTALDALVDHVVPGRSEDSRPANAKELAATAVIRLDLDEVSAKIRTGGANDDPEDIALPYWAGVVPVRSGYGTPVPAADLAPGIELPGYLAGPVMLIHPWDAPRDDAEWRGGWPRTTSASSR